MPGKFEAGQNGRPRQPQGRSPQQPSRRRPPQQQYRRRTHRRRRRRLNPNFVIFCIIVAALLFALIFGFSALLRGCQSDQPDEPKPPKPNNSWFGNKETEPPTEPPTEAPTAPTLVSTATIAATGDVLMHMPVVNTAVSGSGYDFSDIFQYLDDYAASADYAVANLETTLAGTDNGYKYSGYPCFNCPDAIAHALKGAGFDMLLTANNHCYDTRTVGLKRTVQVVRELGLATLGTHAGENDAKCSVIEISGIPVGMMCYSYATPDDYPDRPSMNGILTSTDAQGLINYFDYDQLDVFYAEVKAYIAAMEASGARAIVMYIHWGEEYQLKANANQTAIAQALCDLGIDVIVGGHPHVVQPVELLTSTTDPAHRTVCLYSMGNAISNQRRENMNLNTGHTEDGVLFSFTFAKYSDGEVLLDSVEILPTWVWLGTVNGAKEYRILPLDQDVEDWGAAFDISDSAVSSAESSYERTMELVGAGIEESNTWLEARREEKLTTIVP